MQEKKQTDTTKEQKLFAGELLTVGYAILTSFIVLLFWNRLDHPLSFLTARVAIIGGVVFVYYIAFLFRFSNITSILRIGFPLYLLSFWYSETYNFNKIFPNLDHLFANIEQSLFGFQPAIYFAQDFANKWISEAFYMGYLLYFPMMVLIILYCYFAKRSQFNRLCFVFLGSFFLYYLLFIFLPVAGPQFYFPVIGMENAEKGIFPEIGNYFTTNPQLLPGPGNRDGLFYRLVKISQSMGERPTAAFPSSHVGISTVLMIWLYRNSKKIFFGLLPIYALLCGATVYIQAHYLIDVFAGWISAAVFYVFLNYSFNQIRLYNAIDAFRLSLMPRNRRNL